MKIAMLILVVKIQQFIYMLARFYVIRDTNLIIRCLFSIRMEV